MAAMRNKPPATALPSACPDIPRLYSLQPSRFVRPSNAHHGRAYGGSSTLLGELDAVDRDRLAGTVAAVAVDAGDLVDDLHPGGHPAEDGVLPVQPRRRLGGDDEELAPVRVRAAVCHREGAARDPVLVGLVLELVAGAARPVSARAAALDHEVRDDAVEGDPVVETFFRELHKVVDGLGRVLLEQLEFDRAVIGVQSCLAHRATVAERLAAVWVGREVEPTGLEPVTFWLPARRSPN